MKIDRASLAAVAAVSKDSNRYAINGFYIGPDGTTVATDGSFLVAVEPVKAEGDDDAPENQAFEPMILDAAAVKLALRALTTKASDPDSYGYVLKHPDSGSWCELETHSGFRGSTAQKIAAQRIDGNFPQYTDVIPKTDGSTMRISLNAKKLEQLCKIVSDARKGTCDDIGIDLYITDATKPAVIRAKIADNRRMVCVIMPLTGNEDANGNQKELARSPWESDYGKRARDAYEETPVDDLVAAAAD